MAAMPGKRQRGLQHRQDGHQQQQVDRQRHAGEHAEQHVVNDHEDRDGGEAPGHAVKPLAMFSAPRLGPMVRSSMISIGAASEPARSSSARSLASDVVMPVIWKRAAEFVADHRRRQHFALALFEQHDGHALADVLAGDVAHDAAALGVQRQVRPRLLGLWSKPG
jgi:hypothetical protein